ncbi:MAG: electron transporter RnfA [Lachnospiraceae bacterium]|nr:electron transporter RnfA [Lachnospiraceae bacterium]MDD7206201.1 electron transporter RnfA [Lachnospiraceae bacterium]
MRKEQIITTADNNQKEEKNMNQRTISFKKRIISALFGTLMAVMLMTTTCFAAGDTSAVTQPLDNLKTLIIAVIGAVGVIILAKNVMEFAQAYQQQDSSTMNSALKGVVAGVIMAGISGVLAFLGF